MLALWCQALGLEAACQQGGHRHERNKISYGGCRQLAWPYTAYLFQHQASSCCQLCMRHDDLETYRHEVSVVELELDYHHFYAGWKLLVMCMHCHRCCCQCFVLMHLERTSVYDELDAAMCCLLMFTVNDPSGVLCTLAVVRIAEVLESSGSWYVGMDSVTMPVLDDVYINIKLENMVHTGHAGKQ